MVDKIAFAGTSSGSWEKGACALGKLARWKISALQVARITRQIGRELLLRREHDAGLQQRRELPAANDPRQILATTCTYLENNQPRMNYPEYRRQGLPITSCLVESLIKEINRRVKGTEQFWNRPSAQEGEFILQTTAALLSDGEPLTKHILSRPGSLYYRCSSANPARPSGPD